MSLTSGGDDPVTRRLIPTQPAASDGVHHQGSHTPMGTPPTQEAPGGPPAPPPAGPGFAGNLGFDPSRSGTPTPPHPSFPATPAGWPAMTTPTAAPVTLRPPRDTLWHVRGRLAVVGAVTAVALIGATCAVTLAFRGSAPAAAPALVVGQTTVPALASAYDAALNSRDQDALHRSLCSGDWSVISSAIEWSERLMALQASVTSGAATQTSSTSARLPITAVNQDNETQTFVVELARDSGSQRWCVHALDPSGGS